MTIRQIRVVLDDDADKPRYIETLPRRGFRFIARVEVPSANSGLSPAPPVPAASLPGIQPDEHHEVDLHRMLRSRRWIVRGLPLTAIVAVLLFDLAGLRQRFLGRTYPVGVESLVVLPLRTCPMIPPSNTSAMA